MMDKKTLVDKLTKDVKKTENKLKHRELYNIRNVIVRALIKSGIAFDYALPFILATLLMLNIQITKGNAPFKVDEVAEKAHIETIDTSSGIHIEHLSYDFNYVDELLEHSTGWIINENGLYQRTITTYGLDSSINIAETEKILRMTKEEIEEKLMITNIKTIQKRKLERDDFLYNEDTLIIKYHHLSEFQTKKRPESLRENILHSLWFIILSVCWGYNLRNIEKILLKTSIRDKLEEAEPLFRIITKKDIEELKKILEIKKQNLEMITPVDDESNNSYSYKLRKS